MNTSIDTYLDNFYNECLNFWKRELKSWGLDEVYISYKASQNAVQDIVNIDTWKVTTLPITTKDVFNWLISRNF